MMRVGAIDMHFVQFGAWAQRTLPVPCSVRETYRTLGISVEQMTEVTRLNFWI